MGNGLYRDPATGFVSPAYGGMAGNYVPEAGDEADAFVGPIGDSALGLYQPMLDKAAQYAGYGKAALEFAASWHPAYNLNTALTGKDASGKKVSRFEQVMAALSVLPGGGTVQPAIDVQVSRFTPSLRLVSPLVSQRA